MPAAVSKGAISTHHACLQTLTTGTPRLPPEHPARAQVQGRPQLRAELPLPPGGRGLCRLSVTALPFRSLPPQLIRPQLVLQGAAGKRGSRWCGPGEAWQWRTVRVPTTSHLSVPTQPAREGEDSAVPPPLVTAFTSTPQSSGCPCVETLPKHLMPLPLLTTGLEDLPCTLTGGTTYAMKMEGTADQLCSVYGNNDLVLYCP